MCPLLFLLLWLALVASSKIETEKNNTPANSISKNKNATRVVFEETMNEFGNRINNNNNKFRNIDTRDMFRNNNNNNKRAIEPDEGDPRIVSLDYELIDKVWSQEFIGEYKKKNKQGMSGCQIPVLSVLCHLARLFPVIK